MSDLSKELAAANDGMERAAGAREELVEKARQIAVAIAQYSPDRTCNMDEVQNALIAAGHKPADLGNGAGHVFRDARWKFSGRYVRSTREGSHGNLLRVWTLVR